jgi:tetratricopeptide (TPR) repeat protein
MPRSLPVFPRWGLALMLVTLAGCAHYAETDRTDLAGSYADKHTWLKAAAAHEDAGDLATALRHYRLARVVAPQDARIGFEIKQLQAEIDKRVGDYTKQADVALKQGDHRRAQQAYLQVLILDPDNAVALQGLRQFEKTATRRSIARKVKLSQAAQVRNQQAKQDQTYAEEGFVYSRQALLAQAGKPAPEHDYIKQLHKHLETYPQDREIRLVLSRTVLGQAEHAFQQQDYDRTLDYLRQAEAAAGGDKAGLEAIASARKGFAKRLYMRGLRLAREDQQAAIGYWRYTLEFDPDDEKTRLRLNHATAE